MRVLMTVVAFSVVAAAQSPKLPADIDPQSYSRLPFVKKDQMSADGQKVWDAVAGKDKVTPPLGPVATSLYSPGVAGPMNELNQYIRVIVPGAAVYQICSLLAARAYDEPYEWNSHEGGAKRAGVDQKTIDAIKFGKPADGLPERDAVLVKFGRALLNEHRVSSELYTQVVKQFGQQGMYEITAAIGDYVMAAIMLRAVDQHVPGEAAYPLPPK